MSDDRDTLLDSFKINATQIPTVRSTLEKRQRTLTERLWKLSEGAKVGGAKEIPILANLLELADNPGELEVLARAIAAAAPMLGQAQEMQQRLVFLDVLERTPNWVAGTLGDFSEAFEGLEELNNPNEGTAEPGQEHAT